MFLENKQNRVRIGLQFRYPKKRVLGFSDPGRPGIRFWTPLTAIAYSQGSEIIKFIPKGFYSSKIDGKRYVGYLKSDQKFFLQGVYLGGRFSAKSTLKIYPNVASSLEVHYTLGNIMI